jgi:hypothetical protein
MNTVVKVSTPALGAAFGGGFYAGQINLSGTIFALIVAPKEVGEVSEKAWHKDEVAVDGAKSYFDGLANTNAMLEAGSDLAKWARDLRISDNDDWYIPSQDELEILYRNLKPSTRENWCYARSGINLSSVPSTYPYTPKSPVQTDIAPFQEGGEQAFETDWYWSSTQHASNSDYAWCQHFTNGNQYGNSKNNELRARAVRRIAI